MKYSHIKLIHSIGLPIVYSTREDSKIEMFYNPINRHYHTGSMSPIKSEEMYVLESTAV